MPMPPFSMDLDEPLRFTLDFYSLALKKGCTCKVKYGQHHYDFDQGVMSFAAPNQVLTWAGDNVTPPAGWLLIVHPDLLIGHALGQKIKEYGFFNYALHEALHLSEREEALIEGIFDNIRQETEASIDTYSQDVLLSYLDLLLNYANRF